MSARIEQTLLSSSRRYYTLYAQCPDCEVAWGWRDDDRQTDNLIRLKAEVDEHNKEVHGDG